MILYNSKENLHKPEQSELAFRKDNDDDQNISKNTQRKHKLVDTVFWQSRRLMNGNVKGVGIPSHLERRF